MAATDPPTHGQLAYSRGISFIPPRNRSEASELIQQLQKHNPSQTHEIRADRYATSALNGEHAPSISVRDDEITGYGSTVHRGHLRPPQRCS